MTVTNAPRPRPATLLAGSRVIAVLRAARAEDCLPVIEQLAANGVRMIELTLTTPGVLNLLGTVRDRFAGAADIGVGTITDHAQAELALDLGADFLVTPTTNEAVVAAAVARQAPIFPGGLTPTELYAGWRAGATAVKIFPATQVGPGYVSQLRGPFPDLDVVPSGGVGIDDAADWIAAGALAVSLGGPLLGDALHGGDLGKLAERSRRVTELTREASETRTVTVR